MLLSALLAVGALTACAEPEATAESAPSPEATRLLEFQACTSEIRVLESQRDALDMTLRNLANERETAERTLAAGRERATPVPDALAVWERALVEIGQRSTTTRAEREALEARLIARRAACEALGPTER